MSHWYRRKIRAGLELAAGVGVAETAPGLECQVSILSLQLYAGPNGKWYEYGAALMVVGFFVAVAVSRLRDTDEAPDREWEMG